MQRKAILFIDADNAPSNSKNVPKVLRNFAAVTGYSVSRAFIAANNSANIDTWVTNIRRRHPDASINTAKTATSKDSADIALLFHMGQLCLESERMPVFVMSADKLIIHAAEHLATFGFFVTILLFDNRLDAMPIKVHRLQFNLMHDYMQNVHNISLRVSPDCAKRKTTLLQNVRGYIMLWYTVLHKTFRLDRHLRLR